MQLDLDDLRDVFGFGVAGNFAGHLEQAGEAADFVGVQVAAGEAPKGIFPFYAPGASSFLGSFPLSHDRIATPPSDEPLNLQIEPEVGLLADLAYDSGGVVSVTPVALGAFNDCSIRRPGAKKISEKKNWGADSKGVARTLFDVSDLGPGGPTATMRLASFLRRDGTAHAYGLDSPLHGYSYYGRRLLDWLADRLNRQEGGDDSPLEDVGALLESSGRPARALIGIGATRYTDLGERTFLTPGDEAIVIVYDARIVAPETVIAAVDRGREDELESASVLRQTVG